MSRLFLLLIFGCFLVVGLAQETRAESTSVEVYERMSVEFLATCLAVTNARESYLTTGIKTGKFHSRKNKELNKNAAVQDVMLSEFKDRLNASTKEDRKAAEAALMLSTIEINTKMSIMIEYEDFYDAGEWITTRLVDCTRGREFHISDFR